MVRINSSTLTSPFSDAPTTSVTTYSVDEAYTYVMNSAGAYPRDSIDKRIIKEIQTGTGSYGRKSTPLMAGLTAIGRATDSDNDGMPDCWENNNGLNPNSASDATQNAPDGYNWIEKYCHFRADWLAGRVSGDQFCGGASDPNTVFAPTMNLGDGTYEGPQSVTISCATSGATIYYTTDGSTPTTNSTQYTGAINFSVTTTIKAIGVKSGMTTSDVTTQTYTIVVGCGGPESWVNNSFTTQTANFVVEFDITPSGDKMDGLIGLSNGAAAAATDLACILRFNDSGNIDARNGAAYAAVTTVPYSAGTSYHARINVYMDTKKYDVIVTAEGSSPKTIASQYDFRSEQSTVTQLTNRCEETWSCSLNVVNFNQNALVKNEEAIAANMVDQGLYAYPNPFNPSVTITANWKQVSENEKVSLCFYDVKGKQVHDMMVTRRELATGITWDAAQKPSGIYVVKATVGKNVLTRQIMLMK